MLPGHWDWGETYEKKLEYHRSTLCLGDYVQRRPRTHCCHQWNGIACILDTNIPEDITQTKSTVYSTPVSNSIINGDSVDKAHLGILHFSTLSLNSLDLIFFLEGFRSFVDVTTGPFNTSSGCSSQGPEQLCI
ncbi:hypothetical protein JOB18_040907 [Solea senegalensis]|uniref:Uncharacterized protein n=1 Tax=Solea senegalensis TaxID=28829 RepID=A0AAV6Q3T1_SOLSE|nr:hypothetical protein JOB18_040907 [Solea senegalensis]